MRKGDIEMTEREVIEIETEIIECGVIRMKGEIATQDVRVIEI